MKTMISRLSMLGVVVGSALAPLACGEEFDPVSRVTDFRLIAVRADKPYAAPGERVDLTTLSHEPFGRPITWAWATCVKPDDTTVNACLDRIAADARVTGAVPGLAMGVGMSSFNTTIPANIYDGVTAHGAKSVIVGVLTIACPGTLSLREASTVTQGQLPFRCVDAATSEELTYDRFVVSVKRIYVRRADHNQNPPVGAVTWDGAPWAENDVKEVTACKNDPVIDIELCDGGEQHEVSLVVPPEAIESGVGEVGDPFTEDLVVQYYATEGVFKFEGRASKTPSTKWAARAAAAGKEQTLWFVARENRGGVSWTSRKVRVK